MNRTFHAPRPDARELGRLLAAARETGNTSLMRYLLELLDDARQKRRAKARR